MKLALLGAGDVAQRDYLAERHRLPDDVQIVAIASRTEARARDVATRFGIPDHYTDAERMLARTDIDAVVNLTPMQLHGETNLAILEAGKHLYSEKPFAGSVAEARALQRTAEQRGLRVVSAPSVLLFPQLRFAAEVVDGGRLGAIHSASARAEAGVPPWAGFDSDPNQYFQPGGGPAVDMAVYPLHALVGLLGPVRRVAAMRGHALKSFVPEEGSWAGKEVPVDVDDAWHLLLDFGGERFATVSATYTVAATKAPELEVHGLGGTMALSLLDVAQPVSLSTPDGEWEDHAIPAERAEGPDHLLGVLDLIASVRNDRAPVAGIPDAIHVLEVLEHAARADTDGRIQTIEPTAAA